MQLLSGKTQFDFMGKRKLAMALSGLLLLIAIGSLATRWLELGIDFTGGTLIEVGYEQNADLTELRAVLDQAGFSEAIVQHFGTSKDVIIRVGQRKDMSATEVSTRVLQALQAEGRPEVEMRRVESVGGQVGEELTEDGGMAMLIALGMILLYVWLRFEKRFSVGAIAALVHDVLIVVGVFSVFGIEFDLPVLAAVLAVIGYSLNDTIVVFDRIRENFRMMRKGTSKEIINASLNQTLSRTLMTSLTTFLVLMALFLFGGEIIHGFAFALIIGVLVGTYSSIYVASTVLLTLGVTKEDLMPVEKEGAEIDETMAP